VNSEEEEQTTFRDEAVTRPPPHATELQPNVRGEDLVGNVIWAPPEPEEEVMGWERAIVTQYIPDRAEYEYDIVYLSSPHPSHAQDSTAEWSSADFRNCLLEASFVRLPSTLRGFDIVDAVIWAPPETELGVMGWECLRVTEFSRDAYFPYTIEYLDSTHPNHGHGKTDQWEDGDFEHCFIAEHAVLSSAKTLTSEYVLQSNEDERAQCKALSDRCRGQRLVNTVLWAPPESEDKNDTPADWEKVEVTGYSPQRNHPYEVQYLFSKSHEVGEIDHWLGSDFRGALVTKLFAPVVIASTTSGDDAIGIPGAASAAAAAAAAADNNGEANSEQLSLNEIDDTLSKFAPRTPSPKSPKSHAPKMVLGDDYERERNVAPPLSSRKRGHNLVGSILWAPPQKAQLGVDGTVVVAAAGWEKVRVSKYVPSRDFEYDVEVLWPIQKKMKTEEWESLDFDDCKEVTESIALPESEVANSKMAASAGSSDDACMEEDVASPKYASNDDAPNAHHMPKPLVSEYRATHRLDASCRGKALIGKILWAPPQDGEGWEKVRVERYKKRRQFPYDVVFLWSANPDHWFGDTDEWLESDFDLCRELQDEDDHVVSPSATKLGARIRPRDASDDHASRDAATASMVGGGGEGMKRKRQRTMHATPSAGAASAVARVPRSSTQAQFRTPAIPGHAKRKRPIESDRQPTGTRARATTAPRGSKKPRKRSSSSTVSSTARVKVVQLPPTIARRSVSIEGSSGECVRPQTTVAGGPLFRLQSLKELSAQSTTDEILHRVAAIFSTNYLPHADLPARGRELQSIKQFIVRNIKSCNGNGALFISGLPGTGKTASVQYALKWLPKHLEDQQIASSSLATIRVNCMQFNSTRELAARIVAEFLLQQEAGTLSRAQLSQSAIDDKARVVQEEWQQSRAGRQTAAIDYMRATFKKSSKDDSRTLLVLDEVDRYPAFMRHIFALANHPHSSVYLIGISNAANAYEKLSHHLPESNMPGKLPFKTYGRDQLRAIIDSRLTELMPRGASKPLVANRALDLLSRKVAKVNGDVRDAINIVGRLIERVVKDHGASIFDPDRPKAVVSVPTMASELRLSYGNKMHGRILMLPPHACYLLCTLAGALTGSKDSSGTQKTKIKYGSLEDRFIPLTEKLLPTRFERESFPDLLDQLETNGFVSLITHRSRKGFRTPRKNAVQLQVSFMDLEGAIVRANGGMNALAKRFRELSVRKKLAMLRTARDQAKPGDYDYAPVATDARLQLGAR
jgi:Cdc6-like AAA superfamily ATPase